MADNTEQDETAGLVEVKRFAPNDASQAFAVSTYLNSYGIEVSVWEAEDAADGYRMMVPEADQLQARKLLADQAN